MPRGRKSSVKLNQQQKDRVTLDNLTAKRDRGLATPLGKLPFETLEKIQAMIKELESFKAKEEIKKLETQRKQIDKQIQTLQKSAK
jgi:molecular chaperone DnaK (HSP70)